MTAAAALTGAAARAARYALLVELEKLLEGTIEGVYNLHTLTDPPASAAADVRPRFDWIAETVAALDAIGWQPGGEEC